MKKIWIIVGIFFALSLLLGMFFTIFILLSTAGKHFISGGDEVAIVNIIGELYQSKSVINTLHQYEKRPGVKAIVIRIDSPGGSVTAAQEIYEEVNKIRMKGEKPVIASLGSVAASGGYYIACGAETIVANPGTITGSIGVVINIVNAEKLLDKIGVNIKTITSGEHKDIGSISRDLTSNDEKLLKEMIDNIQKQFLQVIEERRGLTSSELEHISDARILTGEQALKKRLVDELGNLDDAIDIAARKAEIKGEPRIIEEKKKFSIFKFISGITKLKQSSITLRYSI